MKTDGFNFFAHSLSIKNHITFHYRFFDDFYSFISLRQKSEKKLTAASPLFIVPCFHGDVWQLSALKQRQWLSIPRHHRQQYAYIFCMTRYRHKRASWNPANRNRQTMGPIRFVCNRAHAHNSGTANWNLPFHRKSMYILNVGWFQFFSPFYGGRHHNGYHIYPRFRPSWYAWPAKQ